MITYLQRREYCWKRSDSSHFDEESILRTEGMTHGSGVASSGTILDNLVNTVPPMLHGLSIMGMDEEHPIKVYHKEYGPDRGDA